MPSIDTRARSLATRDDGGGRGERERGERRDEEEAVTGARLVCFQSDAEHREEHGDRDDQEQRAEQAKAA